MLSNYRTQKSSKTPKYVCSRSCYSGLNCYYFYHVLFFDAHSIVDKIFSVYYDFLTPSFLFFSSFCHQTMHTSQYPFNLRKALSQTMQKEVVKVHGMHTKIKSEVYFYLFFQWKFISIILYFVCTSYKTILSSLVSIFVFLFHFSIYLFCSFFYFYLPTRSFNFYSESPSLLPPFTRMILCGISCCFQQ